MKRVSFLAAILLFTLHGIAQSNIDVLHYKFNVELNDNNDTIYGLAEIKVRFPETSKSLTLDLKKNNTSGKGMILENVSGPGVRGNNNDDETFTIFFTQPFKENDTATFIIKYKGIPSDGLIISKNKYDHRTFFADNWPNRGHNWLPCHEDPADKATVEFIVTAPQHYQVVSNGIQVEETNLASDKKLTHWKEDVPISTKVMVIGVADFAVNLSGTINNCVPVYSYVYPEDRDKGFYDYAQAAEILPWFIQNVGPYAYKKLANVQSKTIFGGLENANTIFYSEGSVSGTRRSEGLLTHEIAHQWFGNYATEKSFAHLWLSEGFATYMTILYMDNKYGEDTAIAMLKEDREQAIRFGKRNPLPVVNHTKDYMQLLNANSYQKGGWVLHMLRRQLGDEIFWKSIQTYYAEYGGKTADSDDLRKVFEKISGKDLQQFFKQWLFTPANLSLDISWKYNADKNEVAVTVNQIQQPGDFQFPLEILIQESAAGMPKRTIKEVKKNIETFIFSVKKKPARIEIDPMVSLLFEGNISEAK
ncbi:MAG TPA: M1 family aminopeptidase [Chitinophagaceae bacterium]|nr:M1 family peptidase [Chitinophagaceae bacterium]MCB9054240.1 M1 family peptidase [Chitinophagales bacterium]HPG10308.1 M1 family aminopeptidase [Chitinophagaceae bacterium]